VVFAGPLTVRGNSTIIDHGRGIYTAYLHQSEILVKPGDLVSTGQVIGKVGGTGRVTGPHLHWEVWNGGVQVDPMDWLEQSYPR
jgi:murein DD-endopeptidase MepM/ murein hydrolase activator NlpD